MGGVAEEGFLPNHAPTDTGTHVDPKRPTLKSVTVGAGTLQPSEDYRSKASRDESPFPDGEGCPGNDRLNGHGRDPVPTGRMLTLHSRIRHGRSRYGAYLQPPSSMVTSGRETTAKKSKSRADLRANMSIHRKQRSKSGLARGKGRLATFRNGPAAHRRVLIR
jgi:hypothetical protein